MKSILICKLSITSISDVQYGKPLNIGGPFIYVLQQSQILPFVYLQYILNPQTLKSDKVKDTNRLS